MFYPVPPVISLDPEDVKTLEGMSATFLCAATGRPVPTISWYTQDQIDTQRMVNVSDVRVTMTEQQRMGDRGLTSNLTLSSVLPSDAAIYICHADNGIGDGMVRSNGTLTVNGM